jgi:histidine ammonia-lyase
MSLTSEVLSKEIHMKAQPASLFDSMGYPVEDHAPNTLATVRKAGEALALLQQILACELIASAQAFDLREPAEAAPVARALRDRVREAVAFVDEDRSLTVDLATVAALVRDGAFEPCLEAANA